MSAYQDFLTSKHYVAPATGIADVPELSPALFPFQRDIVAWALRRGRAAVFADCGLGKSFIQLEWARVVCAHTGGRVLILAPLAVAAQTVDEGKRFGIDVVYARQQPDCGPGITITNYEMLSHFDASAFSGVVLDESSILKSYTGKTRNEIIAAFARTPFRLACTATPAPNDFMELGNHSEFLGALSRTEMLAMFFVHDGGETQSWRLKGHAEADFWRWVASWAAVVRKPSDLGYPDDGFTLPKLTIENIVVDVSAEQAPQGMLFALEASSLSERQAARRESTDRRVEICAGLVNSKPGPWVVWCALNGESSKITAAIPGAVEVTGSDSREFKERAVRWFLGKECICGSENTRRTGGAGQHQIRSTASASGSSRNAIATQTVPGPTCATGSSETPSTSKNTGNAQPPSAMPDEESCTPETNNGASRLGRRQRRGSPPIRSSGSLNDSSNSGLDHPTTDGCSPIKAAGVPSVGDPSQSIVIRDRLNSAGCTSTTATQRGASAASSAHPVISGSASSGTMRSGSKRRHCTCGYASGNRVIVSKISIFGFGLNFQHCAQVAFLGLGDSYEQFYQAVRRCWRFGQTRNVDAYVVTASTEGAVLRNIQRKEKDAQTMNEAVVGFSREAIRDDLKTEERSEYETARATGERWDMRLGDCVDLVKQLPSASVDYTIFSPPFASLYTYTDSDRDMGNSRNGDEFAAHFAFLVGELFRVTAPGRLLSFHCMDLPMSKVRDGVIGLRDFRGELVRLFVEAGFVLHSQVCIWKDPVTAMQRTKAIGLLYKQLRKDSALSRQGIPDYLVTMRKPGENVKPIAHTPDEFPVEFWQRYASPVWMDINPSRTLQRESAREEADERHICPLQLDVIERALDLWTAPDDLVLSPFGGIGSEGYCAVRKGRRFVGFELKRSYYDQACANLKEASAETSTQLQMFSQAAS